MATPASTSASGLPPFGANAAALEFPWAGAALLVVLVLVAFAAKAYGRRGARPAAVGRWFKLRLGAAIPAPAVAGIIVESSAQLDAHTLLHVVRWDSRRVLLASRAGLAPIVLDRSAEAAPNTDDPT